jgi:hypothetical protein
MAASQPLPDEEVLRILRVLQPAVEDHRIVLVGGQAVAFWQQFLQRHSKDLALVEPLTSKDIDFEGSQRAVRRAAELLAGTARLPDADDAATPNTGIVIYHDPQGVKRAIDFIEAPLPLTARDVRQSAVPMEAKAADGSTIQLLVLHPERCMESRIYNVEALGKASKLGLRQLRVSVVCAREWSRFLLGSDQIPAADRTRAVGNLNERIFRKCLKDRRFRSAWINHGVDPFDAVVIDHPLLPDRMRDTRYPQMQAQLQARRRKDIQLERRRTRASGGER